MKRSIAFLALWLVVAVIIAGLFVPPTPPGGFEWPYHIVVASLPAATLLAARFTRSVYLNPSRMSLLALCPARSNLSGWD